MLGNVISAQRKKLGLTQEQLAQKLDVTNQAVSKWETDQSCPDVAMLPRLADLFEISMDELFGREIPKRAAVVDVPWEDDKAFRIVLYKGKQLLRSSKNAKEYTFIYEGPARDVHCDICLVCGNIEGEVHSGGYVECGAVGGNVDAGGYVECEGILGHVNAGGYVECNEVHGNLNAGSYVECSDVAGSISAGGYVECGNVSGDVTSRNYVECGNVGGSVRSSGNVECGSVGGPAANSAKVPGAKCENCAGTAITAGAMA